MNEALVWKARLDSFYSEASELLARNDGAIVTRAYHASEALHAVSSLTFDQADSLKQAVRAVETGLYRAAFVLAWTALADLILNLTVEEISAIKAIRTRWKFTDKSSLAEEIGDYAIIEALKEAKVISKSSMKSLHGLLHRRNQCAHKSNVFPSPNEALGYIDETITSAKELIALLPDD